MTKSSSQFIPDVNCHLQPDAIPSARILWLQQNSYSDLQAVTIQNKLREQGLVVEVTCMEHVSIKQIVDADLILFNAFEQLEGIIETVVVHVRMQSRVPLIMVTHGYSTEQLVFALKAGVDAVWSLHTSTDVLVARCKAVLRRWIGTFS